MRGTRWGLSCRALPVCFVLALAAGVATAQETPSATPSAADAAHWVSKLNSDDFDERNSASANLSKMGEAAREALEKGAASSDPDIKAAAAELLSKLHLATLTVQAYDRNGKGIAGVSADVTMYKEVNTGNQQPLPLTTGADGSELLTKTEPANYNIYINWKKATQVNANYISRLKLLPGANRVSVQLTQGGACEGRALGADGKPLKDARLFLCAFLNNINDNYDDPGFLNSFGGQVLSQISDEKGVAKFENINDGVYRVIWSQESCEAALGPLVRVCEGQTAHIPDITLQPKSRGTLNLTLTKDDGKPLDKTHFFVSLIPASDDPAVLRKALTREYQQQMYNNGQVPQQTDEKGKATLENLKTGKFKLLLRTASAQNQGRFFFRGNGNDQTENMLDFTAESVEIKAGAPTALTLKPVPGGTLKGKIVNDKGEPFHDVMLSVVSEDYLIVTGPQVFTQNYYDPSGMYSRYARSKQDGTFVIEHLRRGKYALHVQAQSGAQAIVYGLVVADGKTADVSEIKLAAPQKSFVDVKGKVLLANAVPGVNATVYLETVGAFGRGSSGINTNAKGEFDFTPQYFGMGYLPNRIKVTLAGYHPVTIDLHAADVKPDNIVVNLLKRDYGKLCVKAVDEAGKPLAGVRIWPMPGNPNIYNFGRQSISRMQRTNAAGEVHFSGLADGPRKLQIEYDGFFSDPDETVMIKASDEETLFTAVLHTGLKIAGHLHLPEGIDARTASVILTDNAGVSTWTGIEADGKFSFSGLAPGRYTVAVEAPGCGATELNTTLTLPKDQKGPVPLELKTVRNGGAALKLDPSCAGETVSLIDASVFNGEHIQDFWSHSRTTDPVDGSGRTQLYAPQGTYRVLVSSVETTLSGFDFRNLHISIQRSAGDVTLQALKSWSDITKLDATPVKLPAGNASVSFVLKPQFPVGVPREKLGQTVSFILLGPEAVGTFYYYLQEQQQMGLGAAQIIGTPPKELEVKLDYEYRGEHLPPGDYKLYAMVMNSTGKTTLADNKPVTQFTLKDGDALNLGDVKFSIPKPSDDNQAQTQFDYFGYDGTEEDKVELFKP